MGLASAWVPLLAGQPTARELPAAGGDTYYIALRRGGRALPGNVGVGNQRGTYPASRVRELSPYTHGQVGQTG